VFFEHERLHAVQEMILARSEETRRAALARLLPDDPAAQKALAENCGGSVAHVKSNIARLRESNPMLGHRGPRLAVTYREIAEMQVTAIVQATIECRRKRIQARPEIMIPLVGTGAEFVFLRELVQKTIEEVIRREKFTGDLEIPIGTMIEIPRDPFQSIDQDGVGALVRVATEEGRDANAHLHVGVCGEHVGDPDSVEFFHRRADRGIAGGISGELSGSCSARETRPEMPEGATLR